MRAGSKQHGDIGAVIDDEERVSVAAEPSDALGVLENITREEPFVAKLKNARSGFQNCFRGVEHREPAPREQFAVQDRVKSGDRILIP
jgi:hypothetical protein